MTTRLMLAAVALLLGGPLAAQDAAAPPPKPAAGKPAAPIAPPPKLVFEREVFTYPGAAGRRDPFMPLTGRDDAGPLFQDLKVSMILYVPDAPGRSMATIVDGSKKSYRVKRGDNIGNATVLDIGPRRILFAVEDFGVRRQEVLELKPTRKEGA